MRVLSKDELLLKKDEIISKVLKGIVFVHPTDTIYGLGCDARNEKAVARIRKLKKRKEDPFSVIAPSKKWIEENCELSSEAKKWLEKLPGPYTFILKLKNKRSIAANVNPVSNTLGVRMPKHWVKDIVSSLGFPIITTSANQTGRDFMTSMENLDPEISKGLDLVIYEGEKRGKPSTIVDLTKKEVKVKER
jgi:tRNA threonylcarbamoyl adenosine modification protein (Sua5/YciO/YrdC/YwlC family)